MPSIVHNEAATVLGYSFPASYEVSGENGVVATKSSAAAKVGALTTRTDDNTGTLTMDADHGITTGVRLDLFWEVDGVKGHRRGITVGTVSVNSVPIDGGAGDNLPADETPITASVPTSEAFALAGSNATALAFYSDRVGVLVLATSGDAECDFHIFDGLRKSFVWDATRAATNPVSGETIAKAFFSNGNPTNVADQRIVALYS